MRRRLTFLLGAAITLMVVIVAYRSVRRPAAAPQTVKDNACYLRIAAQELALPIKSYRTVTSDGTSERHEPDLAGEFVQVKWTAAVRSIHVDLGNVGISIDHEQLVLLRECSLNIHLQATTSNATVSVPRPISERWFRVSLKEPASAMDRLFGWHYGEDSKKFKPFDVPASQTDWQNIIFPERATIGLSYPSVELSISRNLAANCAGMDVGVSVERVEGAATQRRSDSPPSK